MKPLHHYCSTNTFSSIVINRSIWLSSLSLSNDALEGKLASKTVQRLLKQDNVKSDVAEKIAYAFETSESVIDALGLCLSEDGDLLSQWRGYANDAQGFSVGFSREYLNKWIQTRVKGEVGLSLYQVRYKESEHEVEIRPVYEEVKKYVESGALKPPSLIDHLGSSKEELEKLYSEYKYALKKVVLTALQSYSSMFVLKSDAFREELEWRLITYATYVVKDKYSVRAASNKLIPYREFKFEDNSTSIISEVHLGPKNVTPVEVVEGFLVQHGFNGVKVSKSKATYR